MESDREVTVPLRLLFEAWRHVSTIGVSLARLGSWDSDPKVDERFTAEVYRAFLIDFDVTQTLLELRADIEAVLEDLVGADRLERLAEDFRYWDWEPTN
jgi:hypothetical protein